MSKNYELKAIGNVFKVGSGGPKIQNDNNRLKLYDSTQTNLMKLEVLGASEAHDAINYHNFADIRDISHTRLTSSFTYNDSGVISVGDPLKVHDFIFEVIFKVTTAFTSSSANVTIGVTGDTDSISSGGIVDLSKVGVYHAELNFKNSLTEKQLVLNLDNGSSTAGECELFFLVGPWEYN